ncbi:response regulator [Anaeroselena agilis]|uniref:Response regulator n=1 Tax=Anaeroselena agilis TaxID=3063788 RepID=A0ABU3NSC3_9FIRM|nr:response regulator [Selenomonadales bacterium 4137-cl]
MARILIVDDSLVARKVLTNILEGLGHTVVGDAADGGQAFTEYARHRPDVVTMDLAMQGMSGAEATSKIVATFPDARIVVISALEERQVVIDALERGARHFIIKPVSEEKVAAVLENVLRQNFDHRKCCELLKRLKEEDGLPAGGWSNLGKRENQVARVLIVDDSAVARKALREIMTSLGHTVISEAENGAQAFIEYTRHRPDIVTMDLTMQGMCGAEATSKIVATFPDARIIVISAMEERQIVLDALERGARHFIIKPITLDKVSAILNNVLQQKFDQQTHRELVRRLKGCTDSFSPLGASSPEYLPPYQICAENKLILVKVNHNLTMTSCQSLLIELEEYLTGEPRVLFDFGNIQGLAEAVLAELDKLIKRIESNSGTVKAISRQQSLVDAVISREAASSLAMVIRYFAS